MEEKMIYPVRIKLRSSLDGEITNNNYIGEYKTQKGTHTIVYTDFTGNAITKVGIEASEKAMLIHRVGAFEGDMFFDPSSDTSVNYGTLSLKYEFFLHTAHYKFTERPDGLLLQVEYTMTDRSDVPGIHAFQEITLTKMEEPYHEENI